MKNPDEPEVGLPEYPPDAAHEALFLSDGNLPFMGNVTRRQSRFVWLAARRAADTEIERLTTLAKDAHAAWDSDQDARVGKLLIAMLDMDFCWSYRPDLTTLGVEPQPERISDGARSVPLRCKSMERK